MVGTGFFDVFVDGTLVNTLGPGSLFGELALLFAAPRNATIILKKDEEEEEEETSSDEDDEPEMIGPTTNVLWRIHRDIFTKIMEADPSDQGAFEDLKRQFATNARSRRHEKKSQKRGSVEKSYVDFVCCCCCCCCFFVHFLIFCSRYVSDTFFFSFFSCFS